MEIQNSNHRFHLCHTHWWASQVLVVRGSTQCARGSVFIGVSVVLTTRERIISGVTYPMIIVAPVAERAGIFTKRTVFVKN